MLILGSLGLMHARRVSPAAGILNGHPARTTGPGTAPAQPTHPSDQQPSGNGLVTTAPGSSDGNHA
jgi:hypothetical protein